MLQPIDVTQTPLPPNTMPLIDPWANAPAQPPAIDPFDALRNHAPFAPTQPEQLASTAPVIEQPQQMPTPPPFEGAPVQVPQALPTIEQIVSPPAPVVAPMPIVRPPAPVAPLPPIASVTVPAPSSSRPWDGPTQTQLPTIEEITALPLPPSIPEPPPMTTVAPAQSAPIVTQPVPTLPSNMPPTGYDPIKARSLAKQVAANITNKRNNYARDLLKQFQRAAGIDQDGIYGGESRGALEFFGVRRPPIALFKPTETQPYKWASLVQS